MAIFRATSFTSYSLTNKEELAGQILTIDQKNYIQNQRAQIAEQILAQVFTPDKPLEFVQQDAFLKGQLSVYTTLIDASDQCERELVDLSRNFSEE